jgi:O-methyltransferase/methyltransferase family protein
MEAGAPVELRAPRTDDRSVLDVVFGLYGYPAVLIGHRLGLFPLLDEKPRTLPQVSEALAIKPRPASAILTAAVSLGFVQLRDGLYSLTTVAEEYLLERSPTYFGFFWDLISDNPDVVSFAGLEKAVLTDAAQVRGGGDVFESLDADAEAGKAFTRGMHGISMGPGLAWPEFADLSGHRLMLDVGGGSGAHSIGAVTMWSHLRAIVLDMQSVCEVADEFIRKHDLEDRIETLGADMWEEPFPAADVHFYSNIFHDWSKEKGRFLTAKSFDALPAGGRIIIHEVLYNDDMTGPFVAAGYSMGMLGWSVDGAQYSGQELSAMLTDVGFTDVDVKATFGYYSIVVATKP